MTDFIKGAAGAWAFRWCSACRPGMYVVTVSAGGSFASNFEAVVDDFGNLVCVS